MTHQWMSRVPLVSWLTLALLVLALACSPAATPLPEHTATPAPRPPATESPALSKAQEPAPPPLSVTVQQNAPAPVPMEVPTSTLAPTPTPTPRQDSDSLDIMAVFPSHQRRREGYQEIKGLITEEAYFYAYQKGIDYNVEPISVQNFRELFGEQQKRPDVIWWMLSSEYRDTLEELEHTTIAETEALFEFEPEIHQWVKSGGVLVYSGVVHPAGFKRQFFPYGIELEIHKVEDLPDDYGMRTTGLGHRTSGLSDQDRNRIHQAVYAVGTRGYPVKYIATYKNLERQWHVWATTAGMPAMAAAKYGEGSFILSQAAYHIFSDEQKIAIGMLREAINRIHESEPEASNSPAGVTPEKVSEVNRILEDMDSGRVSESEARSELEEISRNIGKEAFTWIVANSPVFEERTGEFTRFEDYAKEINPPRDPENPTRFEADPVGTSIDLFLGQPDTDKTLEWLGLNQD